MPDSPEPIGDQARADAAPVLNYAGHSASRGRAVEFVFFYGFAVVSLALLSLTSLFYGACIISEVWDLIKGTTARHDGGFFEITYFVLVIDCVLLLFAPLTLKACERNNRRKQAIRILCLCNVLVPLIGHWLLYFLYV